METKTIFSLVRNERIIDLSKEAAPAHGSLISWKELPEVLFEYVSEDGTMPESLKNELNSYSSIYQNLDLEVFKEAFLIREYGIISDIYEGEKYICTSFSAVAHEAKYNDKKIIKLVSATKIFSNKDDFLSYQPGMILMEESSDLHTLKVWCSKEKNYAYRHLENYCMCRYEYCMESNDYQASEEGLLICDMNEEGTIYRKKLILAKECYNSKLMRYRMGFFPLCELKKESKKFIEYWNDTFRQYKSFRYNDKILYAAPCIFIIDEFSQDGYRSGLFVHEQGDEFNDGDFLIVDEELPDCDEDFGDIMENNKYLLIRDEESMRTRILGGIL